MSKNVRGQIDACQKKLGEESIHVQEIWVQNAWLSKKIREKFRFRSYVKRISGETRFMSKTFWGENSNHVQRNRGQKLDSCQELFGKKSINVNKFSGKNRFMSEEFRGKIDPCQKSRVKFRITAQRIREKSIHVKKFWVQNRLMSKKSGERIDSCQKIFGEKNRFHFFFFGKEWISVFFGKNEQT